MNLSEKQPKSIRIIKITFIVFIALVLMMTFVGFASKTVNLAFDETDIEDWSEGWNFNIGGQDIGEKELPTVVDNPDKQTISIKNNIPKVLGEYNCILIESKRQDVDVYIDGKLRSSISSSSMRMGKSLPTLFVLVPLNNADVGSTIEISYTTDSFYEGSIGKVYLGSELSVILSLIKKNIIWFMLITVMLALGMLSLTLRMIFRRSFERYQIFGYLGAYCITSSMYCFNQLRIKQCFFGNLPMLEVLAFCAFALIPLTILMISYGISGLKHRKIVTVLGYMTLANFLVQQLLHNIFDLDYYSMQIATQILILLILAIMILLQITDKNKGTIGDGYFVINSCTYLLLGIIAEAVIINASDTDIPTGCVYLICSLFYALTVIVYCFLSQSREQEGKKKAELANQAKSDFLASMSHEIRTPINAIIGINEIISRETKEESTLNYTENIREASNNLLFLVNDILDYSKIEAGKFDIVEVEYDFRKAVEELYVVAEARLKGKNLEFRSEIDQNMPCGLKGDVVRIKQVVTNLLTNAIKYTHEGGFTMTVKCLEMTDDKATIYVSVKDTGIGVREEDREAIMSAAFVRADQKKNYNIEGTGLGLTISSNILELMGSKLELDSVYGQGSDFHFIIEQGIADKTPIKDKKEKKETTVRAVSFTCPGARILVVDDTKTNIIVMKGLLRQYGIQPDVCYSGEECLEMCGKEESYDLIFLDIMMPGMDGVETLTKMKADGLMPDTPVVALTANAILGAREAYLEQGFDDYMSKPFKMPELEDMLRKHLHIDS